MIAVVVAHAAAAYLSTPVPGLLWAVRDPSNSRLFDGLFWGGVSTGLPLFFTISGFLAAKSYEEKGVRGFLADRFRRIALPFLISVSTVLPLCYVVWWLGWVVTGRAGIHSLLRFRFADREISAYFAGPAHLWFLEYLILILLGYGLSLKAFARGAISARPTWIFRPFAPFVVAVPTTLILWLGQRRFGLDPVMDMRNWFVPDPYRIAHHAWFFIVGTLMYAGRAEFGSLVRVGWLWLGLSPLIFAARFTMIEQALVKPLSNTDRWGLAVSGALFGWFLVFGALGVAQRWCARPNRFARWLADRSYWVYLIHFPIVGLIQVRLWTVGWAAPLKFILALSLTLAIGLLSGEILARRLQASRPRSSLRVPLTPRVARRVEVTSESWRESA